MQLVSQQAIRQKCHWEIDKHNGIRCLTSGRVFRRKKRLFRVLGTGGVREVALIDITHEQLPVATAKLLSICESLQQSARIWLAASACSVKNELLDGVVLFCPAFLDGRLKQKKIRNIIIYNRINSPEVGCSSFLIYSACSFSFSLFFHSLFILALIPSA